MNDLLFLVADKCMEQAVAGLLDRDEVYRVIGCRPFYFNSRRDIKVAAGQNDPGLYVRANELLRPFAVDYQRAVVIVDEEWDGSPVAAAIEQRLQAHLADAGWAAEIALALVVCSQADTLLWSDSPCSATTLGWPSWAALRPALEAEGWVAPGQAKPDRPKEAAEWALKNCGCRAPRSAALYRQVASKASVKRCKDSALERLLSTLRTWFPAEAA